MYAQTHVAVSGKPSAYCSQGDLVQQHYQQQPLHAVNTFCLSLYQTPLPLPHVATTPHSLMQADVVNRGFGGYYTSWFVDYMLGELFNVANPTCAVLFLGTKDTLTRGVSG
jgi:hypothetical protein